MKCYGRTRLASSLLLHSTSPPNPPTAHCSLQTTSKQLESASSSWNHPPLTHSSITRQSPTMPWLKLTREELNVILALPEAPRPKTEWNRKENSFQLRIPTLDKTLKCKAKSPVERKRHAAERPQRALFRRVCFLTRRRTSGYS